MLGKTVISTVAALVCIGLGLSGAKAEMRSGGSRQESFGGIRAKASGAWRGGSWDAGAWPGAGWRSGAGAGTVTGVGVGLPPRPHGTMGAIVEPACNHSGRGTDGSG